MASLISFPTSESAPIPVPSPLVYLPFRRISLPAASAPAPHRASIVSSQLSPQRRTRTRRVHRRTSSDEARDARRVKIVTEFYETEKSYFNGLDLVYQHFLSPILASLSTPNPLLTRQELTTLFSNFIDIWNFHRTFVVALTENLRSQSTSLSTVLLAHFPYLSLYTPFITSFPASLTFLMSLSSISASPNPRFTAFLRTQESHPRCAHLRLSDYLLTLVQRCPRYLLLLKDLVQATDPSSTEYETLQRALGLVEKITSSLDTSLTVHAQTLSLLNLQRNTNNLPSSLSPLVTPGRDLLKRGTLICQGLSSPAPYEFILLSDHLLWLSRDETNNSPGLLEQRSSPRGENERWLYAGHLDLIDLEVVITIVHDGVIPRLDVLSPQGSFALYAPAGSASKQQKISDEREILDAWLTSLRAARAARLAALARVNPDSTLSASGSNVHIRQALRAFAYESADPCENSLAFEHLATSRHSSDTGRLSPEEPRGNELPQMAPKSSEKHKRRAHIDHFLPPVWTPDAKADKCMRCGRPFGFVLDLRFESFFGWRTTKVSVGDDANTKTESGKEKERRRGAWRRKHHCRICGRVVCAACSDKTFYISRLDADSLAKPKPARACTECYDVTFPLLPSPTFPESGPNVKHNVKDKIDGSRARPPTAAIEGGCDQGGKNDPNTFVGAPGLDSMTQTRPCVRVDTILGIPPWLSIPARRSLDVSEALMAMDSGRGRGNHGNGESVDEQEDEAHDDNDTHVGLDIYQKEDSRGRGNPPRTRWSTGTSNSIPGTRQSLDSNLCTPALVHAHNRVPAHEHEHIGALVHTYEDTNPQRFENVPDHLPVSTRPIRIRSSKRPRSYHDILDDFAMHESAGPEVGCGAGIGIDPSLGPSNEEKSDNSSSAGNPRTNVSTSTNTSVMPRPRPRPKTGTKEEDAERRRKRFSLPAVALQTTPVFASAAKVVMQDFGGDRIGDPGDGGSTRDDAEVGDSNGDVRSGRETLEGGLARRRDSSAMGMLVDVLKGASMLKI
ncbi:hypothetical protein M404DRAFT_28761 [Pisolithus tinctorius Marx 270]|uniref:DH domain-containing protein n=1 Tax=Pisolithus tinctorius Marx 270 TaxID=870435 RepID=A0A0C3IXB2_PISTI|nr:hypothetical protein M404DRAFT_28761 [Pisolithus tinctorius Marx 270]